jgi:exosortase A-associated hydrolase 2
VNTTKQATIDKAVVMQTPRGALVGMLHVPGGATAGTGVVFCDPFGEERKSAALVMARLARAVAAAGFPALRFDYYGCGDSEGEFVDATVRSRLDDIRSAAGFLGERTGVGGICLLGLRLGGTLASLAASELSDCAGLVLIEPVADGAAYFGGELRRKLVRQMITEGRGGASREEILKGLERDDAVLDMDGFGVRGATYRELTALGIRKGEVRFGGPVLVCQVHFNEKPEPELEAACEAYRAAGAQVDLHRLVLAPFWNRLEVILAPELNAAVVSWLQKQFGA